VRFLLLLGLLTYKQTMLNGCTEYSGRNMPCIVIGGARRGRTRRQGTCSGSRRAGGQSLIGRATVLSTICPRCPVSRRSRTTR
jgi:hypothetical protein